MFYKHLHDPSCDLFMHGEEAPQSKEAQLQAALDAEREKVKELEEWQRVVVGTGTDQEAVVRMAATEYTKTAVQCWKDENAKLTAQLATLQAQLAAMTESRDAWRLAQECSEKAYMSLATQIPSERYDYDPVNLALLDGAKEQERIGRKQIADLQAQLRQVEGERDAADAELHRDMVEYCQFAHEIALPGTRLPEQVDDSISFGKLKDVVNAIVAERDTLRQLVAALPVVDVQEVSVWLSPDESGWFVSKRPAFPAGLYWAKFRTQAEADNFRALLAYRATLAAKDVHHHTEERHE